MPARSWPPCRPPISRASTRRWTSRTALALLVGTDGVVRAHAPMGGHLAGTAIAGADAANLLSGAQSGTYRVTDPRDRIPRIVSFRRLADYPMIVAVGLDEAETLQVWQRHRLQTLAGGLLLTARCRPARRPADAPAPPRLAFAPRARRHAGQYQPGHHDDRPGWPRPRRQPARDRAARPAPRAHGRAPELPLHPALAAPPRRIRPDRDHQARNPPPHRGRQLHQRHPRL